MGRPAGWQWRPLGLDSDPVPGDPQQISEEARHLAAVAKQITGQVAMLRTIAHSGDEVGKHAEKIRSSAGDLANQLDKVVGRYKKVSSALNGWIPELEKAQAMSIQALNEAEGPYSQLNQQVALPSGPNLTAKQKQQVQDYNNAMNRAQEQLNAALELLSRATSLRDTQGSYYAGLINQACDDAVKDSWWEGFEDWVSQYAGIIKDICTVLEYIATILAIVALFIPGLDIIVILGIAATALALVGRTMLAATGNGSWFDVALDLFALLTFGFGKVVGKVMESTFESAEDVAKSLRAAKIAESPIGRMASRIADFAGDLKGNSVLKGTAGFLKDLGMTNLSEGLTRTVTKAGDLLEGAGASVMEHVAPSVEKTLASVPKDIKPAEVALYGGEKESLLITRNMAALAKQFGNEPEFAELNAKFGMLLNIQRGDFALTNLADEWDKWVGGFSWYGQSGEHPVASLSIPGTEFYSDFKESLVTSGGPVNTFHLARSQWG